MGNASRILHLSLPPPRFRLKWRPPVVEYGFGSGATLFLAADRKFSAFFSTLSTTVSRRSRRTGSSCREHRTRTARRDPRSQAEPEASTASARIEESDLPQGPEQRRELSFGFLSIFARPLPLVELPGRRSVTAPRKSVVFFPRSADETLKPAFVAFASTATHV